MRFRLYYEGPLRATQGEVRGNQNDKMGPHKHALRRIFHAQLQQLWATNKFLRETKIDRNTNLVRPIADAGVARWGSSDAKGAMADVIADRYQEFGYRFVPLVREEILLLCSLHILFLRRDTPGSVIHAGDIDNRLKTLIDGLRRPRHINELVGNEVPADGEDPFYCLLDDDKQVTHIEVETDTLLDPFTGNEADNNKVRLVITVELRPYNVTLFNLSFA
jgi:hypothetical protein